MNKVLNEIEKRRKEEDLCIYNEVARFLDLAASILSDGRFDPDERNVIEVAKMLQKQTHYTRS